MVASSSPVFPQFHHHHHQTRYSIRVAQDRLDLVQDQFSASRCLFLPSLFLGVFIVDTIQVLEDDSCINISKGSNLTEDGGIECDASILDKKIGVLGPLDITLSGSRQDASTSNWKRLVSHKLNMVGLSRDQDH